MSDIKDAELTIQEIARAGDRNQIAAAATQKALWWAINEIKVIGGLEGSMNKGKAIRRAADTLADYLTAAGVAPCEPS